MKQQQIGCIVQRGGTGFSDSASKSAKAGSSEPSTALASSATLAHIVKLPRPHGKRLRRNCAPSPQSANCRPT
jgi:hypothetical protein